MPSLILVSAGRIKCRLNAQPTPAHSPQPQGRAGGTHRRRAWYIPVASQPGEHPPHHPAFFKCNGNARDGGGQAKVK